MERGLKIILYFLNILLNYYALHHHLTAWVKHTDNKIIKKNVIIHLAFKHMEEKKFFINENKKNRNIVC